MAIQQPLNGANNALCASTSIVQMELEALNPEKAPNSSVGGRMTSVRNVAGSIRTRLVNVGKKNLGKSILATIGLFAFGLAAGFVIPALMKGTKSVNAELDTMHSKGNTSITLGSQTTGKKNVTCAELDTLHFGVNKGADFSFVQTKGNTSITLAELSGAQTTENARFYLDMKKLCEKPEDMLSDSFLVGCSGMNALIFEPEDLNQQTINDKLIGTRCNPEMEYGLIYKGNVKLNTTSTAELDSKRMCDEGKIKEFYTKGDIRSVSSVTNVSYLSVLNANDGKQVLYEINSIGSKGKPVYRISTKTHCEKTMNQSFLLRCGENYRFTPQIDLTTDKVAQVNLGGCAATAQEIAAADKAANILDCQLHLGVELSDRAGRDEILCKKASSLV